MNPLGNLASLYVRSTIVNYDASVAPQVIFQSIIGSFM